MSLRNQDEHAVRFCKFVVDPAYRRRGIATMLLADLLKIDEPGGNLSFQCLASSTWTAALDFLKVFGFSQIESEICMECSHLRRLSAACHLQFRRSGSTILQATLPMSLIDNAAYRDDVAFLRWNMKRMFALKAA